MSLNLRPHDIVRISQEALAGYPSLPDWVSRLNNQPLFCVVRRAPMIRGRVAVGFRGSERSQRFGTYISEDLILETYTPQELVIGKTWNSLPDSAIYTGVKEALRDLSVLLSSECWGIGGSLGFELVTCQNCFKASSDLDIIIERTEFLPYIQAEEMCQQLSLMARSVDIQIQNVHGAFHLTEYARHPEQSILLKTDMGPILSKDLWCTSSDDD